MALNYLGSRASGSIAEVVMDPANLKRLPAAVLLALTLLLHLPAAARFGKAGLGSRGSRSAVHPSAPVAPRPYIAPGRGGYPRHYEPPGVWRGHYGGSGVEAEHEGAPLSVR